MNYWHTCVLLALLVWSFSCRFSMSRTSLMSPGLSLPPLVLPEVDKNAPPPKINKSGFSSAESVLHHIGSKMKPWLQGYRDQLNNVAMTEWNECNFHRFSLRVYNKMLITIKTLQYTVGVVSLLLLNKLSISFNIKRLTTAILAEVMCWASFLACFWAVFALPSASNHRFRMTNLANAKHYSVWFYDILFAAVCMFRVTVLLHCLGTYKKSWVLHYWDIMDVNTLKFT